MKTHSPFHKRGFTLLETVIAIGVLAVLLTGFMIVFAPAAAGIKKSISVQEADRLATTLEQELVTLRKGDTEKTGFEKAFNRLSKANSAADALLIYQYRGSLGGNLRSDDTPEPVADVRSKLPGQDYVVQTMVRAKSDANFKKDLEAVEGSVYLVKCTQLVYDAQGQLILGKAGEVRDPKSGGATAKTPDEYPDAVIAFAAEFHALSAKSQSYFDAPKGFGDAFTKAKTPVFTRNLAVRR
jgi:prepilin-type N-terminal cleavage/methylation domain-containing protein